MTLRDWLLLAVAALLTAGLTLWLVRRTREAIRNWFRRQVLRSVHRFRVRVERYKLVSRRAVRQELLHDPRVDDAMRAHCTERGMAAPEARARVERYVDEIVPFFNVLSYYRFGYNLARALINLLYRPAIVYEDRAALNAIPRGDVVVYLMNHRSNADYVVVAYVLAEGVSISYAVGEWARTWPLEYVFKSFGSYFIRRRFREPLYHVVLERYVQLITRNGITQGIFLEGGLSRDGRLRPAKIGLLDYILRTLRDPAFTRDIHLVPVGLNYDRVLEDRVLTAELDPGAERPGRARQLMAASQYLTWNLGRLVTGRLRRYGRVAVTFGTPVSARAWSAARPGVLDLPKDKRLPEVQRLADDLLARIAAVIPVTPVPLVAAALLSFGESVVRRKRLLERLVEYRDHLLSHGARLVHPERAAALVLERAWRTLRMRKLAVSEGDDLVVLPSQRPLLEYYANSIRHLLPRQERASAAHPALEPDDSLPSLRRWEPR